LLPCVGGIRVHFVHEVDHEERLQLERVGSTSPVGVVEQSQLQLERAQSAVSADGAPPQDDRDHEDFV
jgi:hypothetical protein